MTAASDGARRGASDDKTQRYERLRTQLLDAPRAPLAATSAVVLVRQGMSVWLQLDCDQRTALRADDGVAREITPTLPAAEHSELLAVLTGLVFHLCSQKESA